MRVKRNTYRHLLLSLGSDKLATMYENFGSMKELSCHLQIPAEALYKFFGEFNIPYAKIKNAHIQRKIIDKQTLTIAIQQASSIKDLYKVLQASHGTIKRSLKHHKIPYPKYAGKYDCNEDFFQIDKLDEKSMYWAGFLAADGNVRKHKNINSFSLKIELSKKDRDHIELFKKDINSNGQIIDGKKKASKLLQENKSAKEWYYYSYLIINSKKIFDDLHKLGITPRKTYTYTMPGWLINHPLVHHFIRGYMDADGTYSINKRQNKEVSIHIGLPGACPAIKQIWSILHDKCQPKYGNFIPSQNKKGLPYYYLLFNGLEDNVKIVNFIYKDAFTYMKRKQKNAIKVYNMLEQSSLYFFNPQQLQELYDRLGSFNAVAKELKCNRNTIRYNMQKFKLNYKSMPQMNRKNKI